jgi:hypothetical protein
LCTSVWIELQPKGFVIGKEQIDKVRLAVYNNLVSVDVDMAYQKIAHMGS